MKSRRIYWTLATVCDDLKRRLKATTSYTLPPRRYYAIRTTFRGSKGLMRVTIS
jgi:hypothetical protein